MSATSDYEPAVRQDYGPTTSSENIYEHVLDHKLTNKMDISSVRTPVLRAVPISPSQGDPEPDSTNPESIIKSVHKVEKDIEYHINEKRNTEMSVDSLSRIVRIEEATLDNVGRLAYPIIQETDDSDGNYVENAATLIQTPLNTAIVQNVAKLPQNFTINVDAAVGNITAIQNVAQDVSGNQTLWLPTILTTSATDGKNDDDRPPGLAQIIITSESYVNDTNQTGRRTNIITETSYISRPKNSKVQILSNISLPKNSNYPQQYIAQGKEVAAPVYGTQNHIYKLSANVVSQKHLNSTMLSTKPPKSLIGASLSPTVINNSPIKNVPYNHTYSKSTNLNKVNNGANLNALVAASSGNSQCHILSRVVSGPNKISVHSGRKSSNSFKGSKSSQSSNQKNQSRAIKIIQQAGTAKSESKAWPVASVTYKSSTSNYAESNTSKVIQKVGSPTHKAQQTMTLQKVPKGERLVLQSPCGPVLLSTAPISSNIPKGPHYVQSGSTPNLRFVHTYGADNQLSTVSQVSANQQLTAQILQSLSQPKLMLQSPTPIQPINASPPIVEEPEVKPVNQKNQKRLVFGDKSMLLTADDIIGMEERPNLSEELRRYSFQALALIMLDHTYALPAQKQPPSTPPTTVAAVSPVITTPTTSSTAPISPLKTSTPTPVISVPTPLDQKSPTVPTTAVGTPIAVIIPPTTAPSKPIAPPQDDDTASIISSVEGEKRAPVPGGSDTETAPEGEEEGKTRCICDFTHDDGYMICCDRCGEWQHVDCMGIDRNNIPDAYMCELCQPRPIDRRHARSIQLRKREELNALGASDSDSSECDRSGQRRKRLLTVTTYTNTSGSCVTTYNSAVPTLPPVPQPTVALPKRGPKRPKKPEVIRKGTKRKLSEKRVKRKKELLLNRSKYTCSSLSTTQSHWRDQYELAMTNHYSPELRAKIIKYSSKLGSSPNMASAITAHLCTTVPHAGGKILIATKDLKENAPVIELRGKYMLSNQHRPQLQNSARAGSQKPGPFVFFYRLPKDNTQICIDTRTYGNEARFVRRSCKPNAELQHCIVKGALHVYLVTINDIQSNTEITVGHDTNGSKQPCACGNPKHCKVDGVSSLVNRKSIDYPPREKRSRNRCFSSSSQVSPPLASIVHTPVKESVPCPVITKISSVIEPPAQLDFISQVKTEPIMDIKEEEKVENEEEMDLTAKEEMKPDIDEPDFVKIEPPMEEKFETVEKIEDIIKQIEEPKIKPEPDPAPIIETDEITPEDLDIKEELATSIEAEEPELKKVEKAEFFKMLHIEKFGKKEKFEKVEKCENAKKIEKLAKIEKNEKFAKIEKVEKLAKIEKVEKLAKIEKAEKLAKVEKVEKLEKVEKVEKLEKVEKIEKIEEKKEPKVEQERPMTRELTAKSACHDRSSRSSRTTCVNQDSLDDKTDDSRVKIKTSNKDKDKRKMTREERKMEAIMKAFERMEKAQQRKQEVKERQRRRESDPHPSTEKDDDDDIHCSAKKRKKRKGRARTASQSNRRRLNSADSDLVTSGDEAPASPIMMPPAESIQSIQMPEERHERVHEDLGLSSACLLVEAAVGSVEAAFKQPKTKKTMANEWIGRSPERTPSPYQSPYRPTLVSAPSLESLVRVASTIIGDLSGNPEYHDDQNSPPHTPGRERNRPPKKAKRITRSTEVTNEVTESIPVQHSAKKRWLRQAISEESDSPMAESPPNEMVTPLKKRRMARESLCYEQNNLVPCNDETSPVLTSEDSPVKEDALALARQYKRNIMEMYSRDRTRSDSGQGSDDQCNIDHDLLNLKTPSSEHIRRIIGVPTPEEELPPDIPLPQSTNNNNLELDEHMYNKVVPMDIDTTIITQSKLESNEMPEMKGSESPNDKANSSQSADTSGNSSPQRDEMDDIQKKIHSFHTENILILKSRNKKPPKEKRKKVNLNFDLNMVDDQISIQLRTEDDTGSKSPEMNGDIHDETNEDVKFYMSPENIPLPPVESIPLPAPETIPLPEEPSPVSITLSPETIPLPEEPMKPMKPKIASPIIEKEEVPNDRRPLMDNMFSFSTRFNSTGLFSGIFNNMSPKVDSINENVPNMSLIKSAIDRTTSLESGLFDKDISPVDDLKSVQEILTRVNSMDSNNSVLLSGVLRSTGKCAGPGAVTSVTNATTVVSVTDVTSVPVVTGVASGTRPYGVRANDPRLNPPLQDKPKPVRRKLSISEYRKRHKNAGGGEESCGSCVGGDDACEWSRGSSASLSPQRLDAVAAAAADELEQRLHRDLAVQMPKGVFDAQPTASERQRENLSSRLRREFGLALPDDEDARAETDLGAKRCDR